MVHWGWYWKIKKKHQKKAFCSSTTRLDSFKVFKHERFKKTGTTRFWLTGYPLEAKLNGDHFHVVYGRLKREYEIPVEKQACNYGGFRYFFHCPLCSKRMRFLYFAQGEFLCRKCLNLGYKTQRLRPTERFAFMCANIKKKVCNSGGNLSQGKKPPRMHKKTFKRLKDQADYYNAKSGQEKYKELKQWYGPKMEMWLDDFFEDEWKCTIDEYEKRYVKRVIQNFL